MSNRGIAYVGASSSLTAEGVASDEMEDLPDEVEEEEKAGKDKPAIHIPVIVASALIFILVLAWFEVLHYCFDALFDGRSPREAFYKFWYAIFITIIIIIGVYICLRIIDKQN